MLDEAQMFAFMSLDSFRALPGPGSEACNWHIPQGATELGLSYGSKVYQGRSMSQSQSQLWRLFTTQAKKVLASTRYYGTTQARIYSFQYQNAQQRLLGLSSVTISRA